MVPKPATEFTTGRGTGVLNRGESGSGSASKSESASKNGSESDTESESDSASASESGSESGPKIPTVIFYIAVKVYGPFVQNLEGPFFYINVVSIFFAAYF